MSSISTQHQSVKTWRDLDSYLSQSLSDTYLTFDEGDVRQVSTFIKSYIVERSQSDQSTINAWKQGFKKVVTTSEEGLICAIDSGDTAYFIDGRDERFALVHTIGMSADVDKTLESVVDESQSGFDRAWLPTDLLFSSRTQGKLKGFRFAHIPLADGASLNVSIAGNPENEMIKLPEDFDGLEGEALLNLHVERIHSSADVPKRRTTSLQPSSLTAKDSDTAMSDYRLIRESGVFQGRRSLDWVQYQVREESGGMINHTLYNHGKFTANGTSVGLHRFIAENYLKKYAIGIRQIEADHWMGWVSSTQGVSHRGEPLYLMFPDDLEITDLHLFARSIFRAARPFRLFGAFRNISDGRIDIEGIDLHTGDPFSVELTRNWMRLYLPAGTCGNVVARLLTNIQRTTVSDVDLVNGNGERLLAG